MPDPAAPESPVQKFERFVRAGGDLVSVPEPVWTQVGGPSLREKLTRFDAAGGDRATFSVPDGPPVDDSPESLLLGPGVKSTSGPSTPFGTILGQREGRVGGPAAPQTGGPPGAATRLAVQTVDEFGQYVDRIGKTAKEGLDAAGNMTYEGGQAAGRALGDLAPAALSLDPKRYAGNVGDVVGGGADTVLGGMSGAFAAPAAVYQETVLQGQPTLVGDQVAPGAGVGERLGHAVKQAASLPLTGFGEGSGALASAAQEVGLPVDQHNVERALALLPFLKGPARALGRGAGEVARGVGEAGARGVESIRARTAPLESGPAPREVPALVQHPQAPRAPLPTDAPSPKPQLPNLSPGETARFNRNARAEPVLTVQEAERARIGFARNRPDKTGQTGQAGQTRPEILPPAGEGTVPTAGERAVAQQGGAEAVAKASGRVVVEQADGTKALVSPADAARAEALAADGKLAEFVNGEGTSPKPAKATEAVIARDESGAEVRTVLTDTREKTAAAVEAQKAQGLEVEVVEATVENLEGILRKREPEPAGNASAERNVETSGPVSAEPAPASINKPSTSLPPLWDRYLNTLRTEGPEAAAKVYRNAPQAERWALDSAELPSPARTATATRPQGLMRVRLAAEHALQAEDGAPVAVADAPSATGLARGSRRSRRGQRGAAGDAGPGAPGLHEATSRAVEAVAWPLRKGSELIEKSALGELSDDLVSALGKESPELRDRTMSAYAETREKMGTALQKFQDATEAIPKGDRAAVKARILDVVEGLAEPQGAAETKLRDTIRGIFRDVSETLTESGHRIIDKARRAEITKKLRKGEALTTAEAESVAGWRKDYGEKAPERYVELDKEVRDLKRKAKAAERKAIFAEEMADQSGDTAARSRAKRARERASTLEDRLAAAQKEHGALRTKLTARRLSAEWEEFRPQRLKEEISEKLRKQDPDTIAQLRKENADDPAAVEDALRALRDPPHDFFNPGTDLPRKIQYPREWLETDPDAVVTGYLHRGYQKAAAQRQFRFFDEKTGKYRGDKRGGDLDDLVSRSKSGAGGPARKYVLRTFGRYEPDRMTEGVRKAIDAEGAVNRTRLFTLNPSTMLSQLGQHAQSFTELGTRNYVKAVIRAARDPREMLRQARREGVIDPGFNATALDTYDSHAAAVRGKIGKALDKGTAGIGFMDALGRVVHYAGLDGLAKDLTSNLQAGGRRAKLAAEALRLDDLSAAEIAEFAAGEVKPATLVKWKQQNMARNQVSGAMPYRAAILSTPKLAWYARLKTFPMGAARFFNRKVLSPLRQGDAKPLVRFIVGSVIVGEAVREGKEQFRGSSGQVATFRQILDTHEDGDTEEAVKMLVARFADNILQAGSAGVLGDMFSSVRKNSKGDIHPDQLVYNLLVPPSADLLIDGAVSAKRSINKKNGNGLEDLLKFVSEHVSAIGQAMSTYTWHSPSALRKELGTMEKQDKATGAWSARKGQEKKHRSWSERANELEGSDE